MAFPDYKKFVHPIPGNIDLANRPVVDTGDGYATVHSMGIGTGKGETLIPMVHPNGYMMGEGEAIDHFGRTGQHLGIFPTIDQANTYAQRLHESQARQYGPILQGLIQ